MKKVCTKEDMAHSELLELPSGTAALYSSKSPAEEEDRTNEDAAAVVATDDEQAILVVADGAGGHRDGDKAAELAIKALIGSVENALTVGHEVRHGILDGFQRANEKVCELGTGALTTLSVLQINGTTVRPYHVGDSVIMTVGQKGKVKLKTVPHSPVGYGVEAGLIDQEEAFEHDDKYTVLNMVGCDDMRIEIGTPFSLDAKDTVLIASDGLSDNLKAEEIIERIRKGSLEDATNQLAAECKERMSTETEDTVSKPDDLTLIAFRLI